MIIRRSLALLGVVGLLTASAPAETHVHALTACDATAWQRAFSSYWSEYPKAEASDLYKFAHQGIMGSEHAVPDARSVLAWMNREVAELPTHKEPPGHAAPLIEPLPPDGRYVRVHLRPYLARRGDATKLVRAFIATANGPKGDTAQFACAEQGLARLKSSPSVSATLALIRERRRLGFTAAHHSPAFESAYAPAYRVIHANRVSALLKDTTQR